MYVSAMKSNATTAKSNVGAATAAIARFVKVTSKDGKEFAWDLAPRAFFSLLGGEDDEVQAVVMSLIASAATHRGKDSKLPLVINETSLLDAVREIASDTGETGYRVSKGDKAAAATKVAKLKKTAPAVFAEKVKKFGSEDAFLAAVTKLEFDRRVVIEEAKKAAAAAARKGSESDWTANL